MALGQVSLSFIGFLLSIPIHRGSPHTYHLGMNNTPVGGRSLVTSSHPSDIKKLDLEQIACDDLDWIHVAKDKL
jgi:hypothetical protein